MTVIKGAATELGTERIRKLLVQYSVPAIIAMTASSLYNMVDSIFIGLGVGPMAISGLALTFPLMNLAAAFGSLVGVGAATLISMRLGQKDYASAQYILGNVVVLNFIIGLGFGLVTLLFLDPILYFFGASEATIGYARDYMSIILMGNVVTHMYLGLNSVLRSAGHPRKSMYATINTVVINTILDPLFIYGFGWGIRGAAIATVLAQVISLVWQFRLLSDSSELLHFHRGIYRPRKRIVKEILAIGMSPFLMNVTACFIVILINKGLKEHGGDLMIGAYGIVNRLAFFFVMIVMGLNQGMQPIAGYNFGARQYDRVRRGVRVCLAMAAGITLFISVTFYNLAEPLFRLFSQDDAVVAVGVGMMHVLTPVYITYISIEVLSGALRGCGDVRVPTLITVFFVCGLRMLWLFVAVPIRHEVATVELSYPITWTLASALFIVYYLKGGWMQRCAEKWERKQKA